MAPINKQKSLSRANPNLKPANRIIRTLNDVLSNEQKYKNKQKDRRYVVREKPEINSRRLNDIIADSIIEEEKKEIIEEEKKHEFVERKNKPLKKPVEKPIYQPIIESNNKQIIINNVTGWINF